MKVIVLGPNGFVGRHLIARLTRDGHEVVPVGRGVTPHLGNAQAVVNCAGQLDNPLTMWDDNVGLVDRWLAHFMDYDTARFIQVGSSAETGPVEGARSEKTPCNPTTLYEATKLVATFQCCVNASSCDADVVVARPFSLYGSHDKSRKLLSKLWRSWKNGGDVPFMCYVGGHDWLHIDDFVEGLVTLLHAPRAKTAGQLYHFGTDISTSNREVVALFNRAVGGAGVLTHYSEDRYRSYDVLDWRSDSTKARTQLGWSPKVTLEAGIARFVYDQWFEEEQAPGL